MANKPKVYNWIGNSAPTLYWDDPNNWAEGEYPNQPEAIVIFADTLTQDTTILLRRDIRLAHFWFGEDKYSYTIAAEKIAGQPPENEPKLILDTGRPYATAFIDSQNKVDHSINAMITHSCYHGFPHRIAPVDNYVTTIHFNGAISNYKDVKRASVQVYGRLNFKLNAVNSFTGPVVVKNDGEVHATKNGAIPDGTSIYLEDAGKIAADDGILIKAGTLRVDGRVMEDGLYHAEGVNPDILMLGNLGGFYANEIASANKIKPLPNIVGNGAILVATTA